MKVVICSDNHGLIAPLEDILKLHSDADAFIHCGDNELPPEYMEKFEAVTGNNDYFYHYPESLVIEVKGVRFFITHGHQYYRNRVEGLSKDALNHHCDVACYGHTHIYNVESVRGILCVNPGSLRYNRDNTAPCYAIIEGEKGNLKVTQHLTL